MTMTIAQAADGRIVSVADVERGLACKCRCVECGEVVVARKGARRLHHFSHSSQKKPCEVRPESFIHRYAKQVLRESLGVQLPPFPGHAPVSMDTSSWWDFESMDEEVWMGDFRPDLVAELHDGSLLIEVACTSFVDGEKQARIERTGIRTVEIDLSKVMTLSPFNDPLDLKEAILHDASLKRWVYPAPPATDPICTNLQTTDCYSGSNDGPAPPATERTRFTVHGMWVDLRVLPQGSVVLRSVAYNPMIVELLRQLARSLGGYYVAKYRNWMFPPRARTFLETELGRLAEDVGDRAVASATLKFGDVLEIQECALAKWFDAGMILDQYNQGLAPACLPAGEFRVRYCENDLDRESLEAWFRCTGVAILGVEMIKNEENLQLAYKLERV